MGSIMTSPSSHSSMAMASSLLIILCSKAKYGLAIGNGTNDQRFYTALSQGILCLGVLKRKKQQQAASRDQAAKDLEMQRSGVGCFLIDAILGSLVLAELQQKH